ncbi:MAG: family 1 encapsulin nanocompartment shell protein [Armatimonadota bacterium]|nr:bacteriocin family protein [bacterium]
MANKYMGREDFAGGEAIWSKLDEIVIASARSQLSGRRILDVEGPYGLGLKSVPLSDKMVSETGVKLISGGVLPVPLIETTFSIGARDLAAFEETGFSLDTESIARAAMAVAAAEDQLIFEGNKDIGVQGLLTAAGTQSVKVGNWGDVGTAANDIIGALNALDTAGFHGPYLLALSPDLYNLLFRLYPQGYQIEMQHVMGIVGSQPVKAPGIKKGGVLLATGKQFASIIIGQDLTTGFVGPENADFMFKISESLVPRIRVPASVCVLKA